MIDTIVATWPKSLPSHQIDANFRRPRDGAGGRLYCNPSLFPALNLSLYRQPKVDWLRVQASLPKFLYKNNVDLIDCDAELQRAFDGISIVVSDVTGIDIDFRTGGVVRVDSCWNWSLTEDEVFYRIHSLRNACVARLRPKPYEHGIYLTNKSESIVVYSKNQETVQLARKGKATDDDVRKSVGLLRIERRFIGSQKCKREARQRGYLNRSVGEFVKIDEGQKMVNEALSKLGLDRPTESIDSRKALLFEHYGMTLTYERLVGFLELCDQFGPENLIKAGYCPEKFRRNQKLVAAAGAWSTNQSRRVLAPLRAVRIQEALIVKSINV